MTHPENLPRPIGSYDPNEPLIVRYADVIAARNTVAELINALTDQQNPPSDYRQQSVMLGLRAGVSEDHIPHELQTLEEAVRWLIGLRDRLGNCLPFPGGGGDTQR